MTDNTNHQLAPAPQAAATPTVAVVSLLLGLSTFAASILTGIPAIVTGHRALSKIKNSPARLNGQTFAIIGIITGWISVVLAGLVIGLVMAGKLVVPAMINSHHEGLNLSAKNTAAALTISIDEFRKTYSEFPLPKGTEKGAMLRSDETIMNLLIPRDTAGDYSSQNPRNITFFEGPSAPFISLYGPANGLSKGLNGTRLLDPWGNYYNITMEAEINVWSAGADEISGNEDDIHYFIK